MDVATISRRHVAAVMLVILGWAAAAHAEDATLPPAAPAGTRTLADTPFRLVLPQGHLFGDWAGTRTWAEEHGITPTLTFVMDALGNPTGGMQQGFRQASNLGLDLRFDLQKLFGLPLRLQPFEGGHRQRLHCAAGLRGPDVPTRGRRLSAATAR